jgi:hypothetical protein
LASALINYQQYERKVEKWLIRADTCTSIQTRASTTSTSPSTRFASAVDPSHACKTSIATNNSTFGTN